MTRRDALSALIIAPAFTHAFRASQVAVEDDLVWYDVAALLSRLRATQSTRAEVIEAYLRRIERVNPLLNAYVTVTADRAREQARRADQAATTTSLRDELEGIPIAHKDLFETAGIRTTAGSRLFDQHIPDRDATIVAKLAASGAIMLGKTNTHELGGGVTTINPFYGTTRNPWDRTRIAGGSSGGSAAAVAAGLAAAATGSDTGSVRIPAAFCGCVGFKPTFGRVSTAGLLGASPTFDHSGILTRSVEDTLLIYRQIAGYDPDDPLTVPTPGTGFEPVPGTTTRPWPTTTRLRVGIARNYFFDTIDADVARAIAGVIEILGKAKADVRDITFPIDSKTMARVFDPIVVAEIHQRFAREWRERPGAFSSSFAGFFKARLPSGLELAAAHRALREYQRSVRQQFEEVDVILTPTVAVTAPLIAGRIDGSLILRNTWPFNAARTPAISIPCGFDTRGLPIGVQLVAAPVDEDGLFRAAVGLEQLIRNRRRPEL